MGLFTKPEYLEVVLPFNYDYNEEEVYAKIISIEAHGRILNDYKYCLASFEFVSSDYDELSQLLLLTQNTKKVKVLVKVKNAQVKSFKIDLKDLAKQMNDERFEKLSLLGTEISDKSAEELKAIYGNSSTTKTTYNDSPTI